MQLKTILNRVESYKGFIFQSDKLCESFGRWDFDQESVVVEIAPRKNSKPYCSGCGARSSGYDRLEQRLFDYLPILSIPVYFAYTPRRVNCPHCGVKVELLPWANGKSQLTLTLSWYLADWAKMLSWKQVATRFRVSWDSVCRSVQMAVEWGLKHRDLDGIESIGVDEIAHAKGHKYFTLVYQIDKNSRRLLWVGKDRTEKTFHGFFDWFGIDRTNKIKAVCSDMWKAYLKVIKERAPNALHVLDRFHIVAHLNKAVDKVRAEEHRRMVKDGYEPILTKAKWLLLRRPKNLNEEQGGRVKELLKYNLRTMRAYLLKEEFQKLLEYSSAAWAGKFLNRWCTAAMRSKLEPMKKVAKMMRKHHALIMNWFAAKGELSSGIVEGLNTNAKLTARKSYGFKSPEMQETALYHVLGDLPTPEWTHRFC